MAHPQNLAHYHLVEKIGEGGMGEVWKALDMRLERWVALKVLPERFRGDERRLESFRSEARAVAALSHPGIVTIYSVEQDQGIDFITMELVSGRQLRGLIPDGGMPLERLLRLGTALADAVDAAHLRGIVHRDLKPANIMVDVAGRVKVLDFGLAQIRARPASDDLGDDSADDLSSAETSHGRIIGTLPYMAPEVLLGDSTDHRVDLFALGVILFEMATGRRPWEGRGAGRLIPAVVRDQHPPVRSVRADLPDEIELVIDHCLHKIPSQRLGSAGDLRDAIQGIVESLSRQSVVARIAAVMPVGDARPPRASIAVMPFQDLSPESDQAHLCEGLAEDLVGALGAVKRLRVASRSAAAALAGDGRGPEQVAAELHVAHVLGGSVQKAEDRLRVTVELSDARGTSRWSRRFEGAAGDVFTMQDEICTAVVDELELLRPLRGGATDRAGPAPGVYELVLKGRYLWNQRYAGGLEKALEHFERATQQDPAYPPAHAGLADCYIMLGHYGVIVPDVAYRRAREAAAAALEIDEDVAEAHASMAWIQAFRDGKRATAESSFRRTLELNPNYAIGYEWYGLYLLSGGHFDEAIAVLQRAEALDPLALMNPTIKAYAMLCAGRPRESIGELDAVLEIDRDFMVANLMLGMAHAMEGRFRRAMPLLSRAVAVSGQSPLIIAHVGYVHGRAGNVDEAHMVLRELDRRARRAHVSSYQRALVHLGLDDIDTALELLEAASEERDSFFAISQAAPHLDPVRDHARFRKIRRRLGLGE